MEQNPRPESPPPPPPPPDAADPPPATGTGLYYKDGTEIPPTHPDHGPMHLLPRQQDGSFATYYYCSKAELYDMQIPAPLPRRHRRDGFTPERQEQFLEAVRGGASGREAARKVGISATTAYNLYNSPDGAAFRAAWDEAAKVTDIVLEDTAFDRAVNGQEEIVFHKGERVGKRWKYDNNLLMRLLRARNPLKYAPLSEIEGWLRHRGIAPPADVDKALDRLRAAEAEWGRRLPGEEAPAAIEGAAAALLPGEGRGPGLPPRETEPRPSPGNADASTQPLDPSTSSTSPESGQPDPAAVASTSSTSPGSGQAGDAPVPSTSSTSSGNGQDALRSGPEAPDPGDGSPVYRPPPRPRIVQL